MSLQQWQTFFQIMIMVGIIFTAIGSYGSFHIGKKVTEKHEEELMKAINNIPTQQLQQDQKARLSELKNKLSPQRKAVTGTH